MSQQARFKVDSPNGDPQHITVDQSGFQIGREEGQNDLVVDTRRISRQHLRFSVEDGICFVEDLHSSNGVELNGKRIVAGRRVALDEGAVIDVPPYRFIFQGFIQDATDDAPPEPTPVEDHATEQEAPPEPTQAEDHATEQEAPPEPTQAEDHATEQEAPPEPTPAEDHATEQEAPPEPTQAEDHATEQEAPPEPTQAEDASAPDVQEPASAPISDDSSADEGQAAPQPSQTVSDTSAPVDDIHKTQYNPSGFSNGHAGDTNPPNVPTPPTATSPNGRESDYPFGIPHTESTWLRYLPAVFHDYDFLTDEQKRVINASERHTRQNAPFISRFLLIFESIMTPLMWHLDNFDLYLDERIADERWLQWVASWFDLLLLPELPEDNKRKIIRQIGTLFKQRGTRPGLERLLTLYFNLPIEITEPEGTTCHFEVRLFLVGRIIDLRPETKRIADQNPTEKEREIRQTLEDVARRLIDSQCPAFATYHLVLEVPST